MVISRLTKALKAINRYMDDVNNEEMEIGHDQIWFVGNAAAIYERMLDMDKKVLEDCHVFIDEEVDNFSMFT